MSHSYLDEFRDAFVKRGAQRSINSNCPKCNHHKIEETDIYRTASIYVNNRFAGKDYWCPNCHIKWKVMDKHIRPGIYIRTSKFDEEFTKKIAQEIIDFIEQRFSYLQDQFRARKEKQIHIMESAIDEVQYLGQYIEEKTITASRLGDIEERMVDYFWRVYRSQLDNLEKAHFSGVVGFSSDLYARMAICRNTPLRDMWDLFK